MQLIYSKKAEIIFKILGETLKYLRSEQKKSIRLLADEYELQKSMISRIENGKNEPKLVSVLVLCEALEIAPSELFKMVENKLPPDFSLIEK